ncbi:MAG: hypothetical protein Q9165_004246 [Trypethelium subeluteriae]
MEAIAAVSSFAGIIGLAGQCVGGLETLKNLFESIAAASKTVDGFLRDINGLLRTLHDLELLLNTISKKASADEADADVASLQIQLEDCSRDISSWLKTARDLRPSPGRGTKSWARKFWVAVNQESVRGIRQEISCRRTEINTSLLLLSTTRGIYTARKADAFETKVELSNVASSEQLSNSNANIGEILQRLETLNNTTMSILSHSEGSMRSFQSVSSSISRMSGASEDPPPPYRAISGRSSSDYLRESSRPSTAQSARRALSSGSQTSLSIFGLSSVVENVRLEHDSSEKLSKYVFDDLFREVICISRLIHIIRTILRSSRFPNRYTCGFCTNTFANKKEAERHVESLHERKHSWSCSALRSIQDAFFQRQESLICGYCETQVAFSKHPEAALLCRKHLRIAHRFQQCNLEKRFWRIDHFRQHLKHSHGALIGKWTEVLEDACLEAIPESQKDRVDALRPHIESAASQLGASWRNLRRTTAEYRFPRRFKNSTLSALSSDPYSHPEVSDYVSRMRLVGLLKQEIDFIDHILTTTLANDETTVDSPIHAEMVHQREELKVIRDDVMYSAEYHRKSIATLGDTETKICDAWSGFLQDRQSEDDMSQPGLPTDGIMVQSYNASLLGNWNGTRDRVNRWLLHSLGSSEDQAKTHRSMLYDPEMPVANWGRIGKDGHRKQADRKGRHENVKEVSYWCLPTMLQRQ